MYSAEYLICATHSPKWFTCFTLSNRHLSEEILYFINKEAKAHCLPKVALMAEA